jgi:hypothetical protein
MASMARLGHAGVVLELHRADLLAIAAVAHGADEAGHRAHAGVAARSGRLRRRGRSPAVWMLTRATDQPPVTGGKKATSAPSAAPPTRRPWPGSARSARRGHGPAPRHGGRRGRSARRAADPASALRAARQASPAAQGFAQRGEVAHLDLHQTRSVQRQEAHRVTALHDLAGRVVDQAVGPHGRGQHARALVAEQVQPARRR